jgi:hypothetical protein
MDLPDNAEVDRLITAEVAVRGTVEPILLRGGGTVKSLSAAFLADLEQDWLAHGKENLGVVLGDRRKMLRAIGELGAAPGNTWNRRRSRSEDPRHCRAPPSHGDVLRFGRIDSTLASIDPEDLREVISAYQKCVAETVRRFGSYVAKYLGDGVLVYFGYRRTAAGRTWDNNAKMKKSQVPIADTAAAT